MEAVVVTIALTDEQEKAVESMVAVLTKKAGGQKMLKLGGLAGTGKTTIINEALRRANRAVHSDNELVLDPEGIAVSAFTGKAVSVLRKKGIPEAKTLHSLMYEVETDSKGKMHFFKKPRLYVPGVIVDEASMLNMDLYMDLMSYQLPTVFVGDHGQLEPVGDDPGLMRSPDIRLEQIHRQAAESRILQWAHACREGTQARVDFPKNDEFQRLSKNDAMTRCHEYDAVLCGFNKTRVAINSVIRHRRGFEGDLVPGERLICLRNNRELGVFNGMMMTVEDVHNFDGYYWDIDVVTDTGQDLTHQSVALRPEGNPMGIPRDVVIADYGYCLTVHKSQGSEWNKVLVFEEIWADKWDPRRWRYTAATRAAKHLSWSKW